MSPLASLTKTLLAGLVVLLVTACSFGPWSNRGSGTESSGDAALTRQVQEAILNTEQLRQADIQVSTVQGVVTLSGVADSIPIERKALEVARSVPGVRQVKSSMIIQGRRSSAQQSLWPTPPHQTITGRGVQMHHSGETTGTMPNRENP